MNNNTQKPNSFWDENALLHPQKGEYSENGILFAAYFWMAHKLRWQDFTFDNQAKMERAVNRTIGDGTFYNPNPAHDNAEDSHFSHDNMTGLYALADMAGYDNKNFPVKKWNKRAWLHPRDLIFYNIMKGNKVAQLFLPLIFIMAYVSCKKERGHTSGKCMWWLRLNTLKFRKDSLLSWFGSFTLNKMTKLIKKEHGETGWQDVFSIYFAHKDHPVNQQLGSK